MDTRGIDDMQTKNRTAVITEAAAQAALRRGPAPELAPDEERVTRMRLGAPLPRGAPLERKVLAGSDAEIELLAWEIETFLRWKAHVEAARAARPAARPAATVARAAMPISSRTKEKIVRALRRKV
jgi:hypothetical protein